MLKIDFFNIENLILCNNEIKFNLKKENLFNEYLIYKRIGDLNKIKKIKLDLLDQLNKEDINYLEKYFGQNILIKKMSANLTKNISFQKDSEPDIDSSYKDFCVYRNKSEVFITFWR